MTANLPANLIDDLLAEQQSMTAVARFSRLHERHEFPAQAKYYRDLIPLERPRAGEQYAFAVELDACTGCKACVSACHSLNGLDDGETWRDVGVLFGGSLIEPVQQTVTTACHHCVDPACLNGCPVMAYEKDDVTGIVRHLDDQCIGCQYCVLKCPYDVPKYNAKKGIVRKCDMCSSRLGAGEAPACVQACPNEAIRIEVVSKAGIMARAGVEAMVPGAFASNYTRPATRYASRKPLPDNMEPGDTHSLAPEHAHLPLVAMLTLTQWAAGAFCADFVLRALGAYQAGSIVMSALVIALAGLGASVLHLGRPSGAWRAFLGLRTSWLSREIVVFGMWSNLALILAGSHFVRIIPPALQTGLSAAVAGAGLLGVFCSVMVYVDTRRAFWLPAYTGGRFFGTALLLGTGTAAALVGGSLVCAMLAAIGAVKLGAELLFLRRADVTPSDSPSLRRSALVMRGPLRRVTAARFVLGAIGVLFALAGVFSIGPAAWLALAFLGMGEFAERYLFFTAVRAPRMPGGIS